MSNDDTFSFEISLSVLNHLGRNLYRSFMTVLGEAISNSWDADAQNVWVYIDRENNSLIIKDDGNGMDSGDFQGKFLKIGYSKRRDGKTKTDKDRPFIGRKGIGKLALLSCAAKITVLSKTKEGDYVGGVIDNTDLSQAITDDLTPNQYLLGSPDYSLFANHLADHQKGTIIHFEDINEGIRNSVEYLKKLTALYFRFSLLDDKFNIFVNDEKITYDHLKALSDRTQFLWAINNPKDPYVTEKLSNHPNLKIEIALSSEISIKGFIASVEKPSHLKVISTNEKVSVDLFVNGRLREKDILKHIPSARIVESYLYGQIHFDELDGEIDRFTSSREGIVADDPKFKDLLKNLRESILPRIIEDWDKERIKLRQDGDPDNTQIPKKERKARELFNAISDEYSLPAQSPHKEKVDGWVGELEDDAQFNFSSYAECFISENLVRKYIQEKSIPLSQEAENEKNKWKGREQDSKEKGNISIAIRRSSSDLGYLSMDDLANLVDKKDPIKYASLARDAKEYKPMRDAVAHTALLTDTAKSRLTLVYENIKARIKTLLSE